MIFQPADIFACHGTDWTSRMISAGTASIFGPRFLKYPPSHVAICGTVRRPRAKHTDDHPVWIESTTLSRDPCIIRKQHVRGMQAHEIRRRIEEYRQTGGRVDLYRLSDIQTLDDKEARLLNHILVDYFVKAGKTYDYEGALLAGTRLFQRTRLFPGADLNRLFCSEVIAAVLMRLGRMNRDNPTKFSPGSLLRCLVSDGTYYLCQRDVQPAS